MHNAVPVTRSYTEKRAPTPGNSTQAPMPPLGVNHNLFHPGSQPRLPSPSTIYTSPGHFQAMPSYPQPQHIVENHTNLQSNSTMNKQAFQPPSMMNLLLTGPPPTDAQSLNTYNPEMATQAMAPFPNGQLGTGI